MKSDAYKFRGECTQCTYSRMSASFHTMRKWMNKHGERMGHATLIHYPERRPSRIAKRSTRTKLHSSRVTGKLPGVRVQPKTGWRKSVDRNVCVCCQAATIRVHLGDVIGTGVVDHLIPARYVTTHFTGFSPEANENLNSLCAPCHGRKLRFEHMLHAANFVGFIGGLKLLNFPIERMRAAFSYYGVPTSLLGES